MGLIAKIDDYMVFLFGPDHKKKRRVDAFC